MSLSHTTVANRSTYYRCILYFTELNQLSCVSKSADSLQQEEVNSRVQKLRNVKLHDMYSSPDVSRAMNTQDRMGGAVYHTCQM